MNPFHDADLTTWTNFPWPDWVPAAVRAEIERFWGVDGRTPEDWIGNAQLACNHAPAFGEVVSLLLFSRDDTFGTGRYVHAWNNIGRLVLDDGTYAYVSTHYPKDTSTVLTTAETQVFLARGREAA